MENSNSVDTPMTSELTQLTSNRPLMNDVEAKSYRRAVARVNYMAQYRCDLSSASKAMTQSMANPRRGDEMLVKRVIRYLRRYPRGVNHMDLQDGSNVLTVMTDSDWAGDINSRRSTSGGTVLRSNHVLCHWSKLQVTIALSSGEAEVNASVKGISEVIGVCELLK